MMEYVTNYNKEIMEKEKQINSLRKEMKDKA